MTELDIDLADEEIELRPVLPEHHRYLYWLALSDFNNVRWRYRGQLPPFEVFVQQLHADVLAQFVIGSRHDGTELGYCVGYGADQRNRHCYVGVLIDPRQIGLGTGSRALELLTGYLFRTWDFHKVFAEVPAFTLESMRGKISRLSETATSFEIEATLTEYLYHDGRMWDMYIVSTTGERWRTRTSSPRGDG